MRLERFAANAGNTGLLFGSLTPYAIPFISVLALMHVQ
jgi:hypothetical protein